MGNPYLQSIQIIKNIQTALQKVDASLKNVVRTRIYTTDIDNWEKIGQAHLEFFREIRPACTLVEVSHLISPEILVEMESSLLSIELTVDIFAQKNTAKINSFR